MNIINKFLLRLALSPGGVYKNLGVNTHHLKAILTTKLIIDDRRPNTFKQTQTKKSDTQVSNATLGTMLISAVFGIFFIGSFYTGSDYVTHLTIYYTIYIFMLASTLISDFTSVLIDVRDNFIILPKPVNDRTVVIARLLHITIHISKMVFPMTLPAFIYLVINTNVWGACVFLLMSLLATLFTVFLINALYILILKVTTPQKFQSVISYFQVGFAVFLYAGYQLLPRLVTNVDPDALTVSTNNLRWMAPSYWFAAAWSCLAEFQFTFSTVAASVLSFIVPFASIWLVIKYFAPSFNRKLSQIGASESEPGREAKTKRKNTAPSGYSDRLANWFAKEGAERMAFLLCWKMTSRSKDFKLKVYPFFGYMLVFAVTMFLRSKSLNITDLANETARGRVIIVSVLYFSSSILLMAMNQVIYAEKFKAAWIYFITPVKTPGLLISGAVKAIMLKFNLPAIVLISVPAIALAGIRIIPNILFALVNELFICTLVAYIVLRHLPFSVEQSTDSKSGSLLRGILTLFIPVSIGIVHYLLYPVLWVVSILCILSFGATWLVMSAISNKTWAKVQRSYNQE